MVVTFVTDSDPVVCAKNLTSKHLGKQRVEAYQIINILESKDDTKIGFMNHPIRKMWADNIDGLKYYFNCCVKEWVKRGYKNTMKLYENVDSKTELPWWFKNKQVQASHVASLMRKNPEYTVILKDVLADIVPQYMDLGYIWTCSLSPEIIEKMKRGIMVPPESICSPFGTGVPPQYRISKDVVDLWLKDKTVNPTTGRKIKENGSIWKDYNKASKYYYKL